MKRNLNFKKLIIYGLLFTSPIASVAEIKPESPSSSISEIESPNTSLEIGLDSKYIDYLHMEGAISAEEVKKYQNKNFRDSSLQNNIDNKLEASSLNKITNSTLKNKGILIDFIESKLYMKLKFINVNKLKSSEITKTLDGWQIIIQLFESSDIDLSRLPKKIKHLSGIKINKFNDSTYIINIINNKDFIPEKPIIRKSQDIEIDINFFPNKSVNKKRFRFPFLELLNRKKTTSYNASSAVAPPLGDIAVGNVVLKNRGFIQLEGPKVSLTLNNASAKDALMKLSKLGGYGFVLANNYTDGQSNQNLSTDKLDRGPKVTLSFVDEDYSVAFNSVLLASGLQGKKNNNLIIVGDNVLGKSFGPQISKVYRLNQASAASAADYLATLGASMSKVDTLSSSTTSSSAQSGSGSQNNNDTFRYIDSYSSSSGPLKGLIGTTDSRLQSITLVGSSELILIAEKYLKQLDLRQRQVALSVKILDVDLSNNDSFNNDFSFRSGTTFIVNEKGKLFSAFGNFIPPSLSSGSPSETTQSTRESSTLTGTNLPDPTLTNKDSIVQTITTTLTPNPGLNYTANQLYDFLTSQITSSSTKVLANPTLILSESAEKIIGGAEVVSEKGRGQASIGRPFGNESFVTLGTNVITDYKTSTSEEGGITTCEAEFSTAGLTFGARVNKIDDNGYVTFSLSPELTSVSETRNIPNCGDINILSVTRLDTGNLRVRDSQTLILTGVINELETELISKIPLLGDIPILGRLFRSTSEGKRKSELIIMVTPKIIDDSVSNTIGIGYKPSAKEARQFIEE